MAKMQPMTINDMVDRFLDDYFNDCPDEHIEEVQDDLRQMIEAVAPLIAADARRAALEELLAIADMDADAVINATTIRTLIEKDKADD